MNNQTKIKIPKKYQERVEELWYDSDGYWLILKEGWRSPEMDCRTIHEDTQARVLNYLRGTELERNRKDGNK